MTLGYAVEAALPGLRAEAESLMTDLFYPYSPDPDGTTTNAEGFEVPGYIDEAATRGRIAGPSAQSRDTQTRTVVVGGVERPVVSGGLHIPIGADIPTAGEHHVGWEYELVELGPTTDPSLLYSRWLVVDSPAKSAATARRLDVVRIA